MNPALALAGVVFAALLIVAGVFLVAGPLGGGIALIATGAGIGGACLFLVDVNTGGRSK